MIETKRLIIRPLDNDDFLEMIEYMSDDETLKYEQMSPFTLNGLETFVKEIVPARTFYAVILKESNKLIGHLFFGLRKPIHFNEYMVGYIFNPKHHNRGYCTESVKALINYGFNELKMHRVTAMCNPDNIASWRVMEKVGLHKEGLLKKKVCFKYDEFGDPIWWDELIYGLTIEEYKK